MIIFKFTTLEYILLAWFLVYILTLCLYTVLAGEKDIKIENAICVLLFLPFVLVLYACLFAYHCTIGALIELIKERKTYREDYFKVKSEFNKLKKELEDIEDIETHEPCNCQGFNDTTYPTEE